MKVVVGVCFLVVAIIYFAFGTVEPCGIVREQVRQAARREGGAGLAVAAIPDILIDAFIETRYGPMSPGRCLSVVLSGGVDNRAPVSAQRPEALQVQPLMPSSPPAVQFHPAPVPSPPDPVQEHAAITVREAVAEMKAAIANCRNKRIAGELPSYAASANCSNPRITEAFVRANYRDIDLIYKFAAERLRISEEIDQGIITAPQGNEIISAAMRGIDVEERRRDAAINEN